MEALARHETERHAVEGHRPPFEALRPPEGQAQRLARPRPELRRHPAVAKTAHGGKALGLALPDEAASDDPHLRPGLALRSLERHRGALHRGQRGRPARLHLVATEGDEHLPVFHLALGVRHEHALQERHLHHHGRSRRAHAADDGLYIPRDADVEDARDLEPRLVADGHSRRSHGGGTELAAELHRIVGAAVVADAVDLPPLRRGRRASRLLAELQGQAVLRG